MNRLLLLIILVLAGQLTNAQSSHFKEDSITLIKDSIDIKGTLCIPTTVKGKLPVVLIIAGSGPTDRDGNSTAAMLKSDAYKQLAHALANAGIATVRYDKRAVGKSLNKGVFRIENLFEEEVQDVRDWIILLKKDKRFSKLIIAGHSQGALMGLQAASAADKFISLNGLGVKANELLRDQMEVQPPFVKDKALPIIDSLEQGIYARDIPPYLQGLFSTGLQTYWLDMFKIDPVEMLAALKIPVLVVQGDHDIQVKVKDAEKFISKSPTARLLIIPGMNHILKQSPPERMANIRTYSDPALPIDSTLVAELTSFIKK